jgi:hypothetical protein
VPNAGFKDIVELVMTAFLLIGGCGKSSRPGASDTWSGRAWCALVESVSKTEGGQ